MQRSGGGGGEAAGASGERGSLAVLPPGARPPFRVWVNGVEQSEGSDYVVEEKGLRFSRPLAKEGRLGFWRWTMMFFGIAGTYRKNDSVDVQYESQGGTRLVTGLELQSL